MIVPLSRTRWSRRLATTTAVVTMAIGHITAAMATGGRITAMATDGPTMVTDMDMGVAGATKRGPAKNVDF